MADSIRVQLLQALMLAIDLPTASYLPVYCGRSYPTDLVTFCSVRGADDLQAATSSEYGYDTSADDLVHRVFQARISVYGKDEFSVHNMISEVVDNIFSNQPLAALLCTASDDLSFTFDSDPASKTAAFFGSFALGLNYRAKRGDNYNIIK